MKLLWKSLLPALMLGFEFLIGFLVNADSTSSNLAANKLSLKEAIRLALENNYDLKASAADVEAKAHEVGPRSAYSDPELSFEAQNYPKDSLSPNEYNMTGNQIYLSQKIPFPGKLTKLGSTFSKNAESSSSMLKEKDLNLIRDVKIAYFALLMAQKQQVILLEEKKLLKQVVNVTRQNFTAGKSSQGELLGVQVQEAGLLDELLKAREQIKEKSGDLDHLLSQNHSSQMELEEIEKTSFDFKKLTEAFLMEKTRIQNPSIKAKFADFESSAARLSYARQGYLPDFDFGVGYTLRRPSPGDRGVDFLSARVRITLPLWAGSKQSEEIKVAEYTHSKTKFDLEEEKSHLLHSVHTTYSELEEASQRLDLYDGGLLPLSRQAVSSGLSAYQANRMNFSSLFNSIRARFQTELNRLSALYSYEIKIATLEALLGEPLGDHTK